MTGQSTASGSAGQLPFWLMCRLRGWKGPAAAVRMRRAWRQAPRGRTERLRRARRLLAGRPAQSVARSMRMNAHAKLPPASSMVTSAPSLVVSFHIAFKLCKECSSRLDAEVSIETSNILQSITPCQVAVVSSIIDGDHMLIVIQSSKSLPLPRDRATCVA